MIKTRDLNLGLSLLFFCEKKKKNDKIIMKIVHVA